MDSAIAKHEGLLEGLETRLRAVEVPIEDNTERVENINVKVNALGAPITNLF